MEGYGGMQTGRKPFRPKKDYRLFWMALPFALFIMVFYYAQLFGWIYAFTDYKPAKGILGQTYVGFKYFLKLFAPGSLFPVAFRNTLIYGVLNALASPVALIFAGFLSEVKRPGARRAIQTLSSFPNFISWILVYSVAFMFFSSEGQLTKLADSLGLTGGAKNLLANAGAAYLFQTLLGLWKTTGWSAIIYLSAIAGIDQELYDAADVDGASRYQKMYHITVKSVLPTFFILLILGIGGMMNAGFEQFYVFYNPMVADRLEILATYAYRIGLGHGEIAFGTAIGMTQSLISVLLLVGGGVLSKKISGNSIL
jgi:ABC-type polysaccharide transport system permease subunit